MKTVASEASDSSASAMSVQLLSSCGFNLALNVTMMCCSTVILSLKYDDNASVLHNVLKEQQSNNVSEGSNMIGRCHHCSSFLVVAVVGAAWCYCTVTTSVLGWSSEVVVREQVLPSTSCVIWRFHTIKVSRKFQSLMTELLLMCFLTGEARLQVNAAEKSVLLSMEEMRMIWEDKCEHSINMLSVGDMMHKIQAWKPGNMEFC